MALRDLLWGCPLCGSLDPLAGKGGRASCRACGATYRRSTGAAVEARPADGPVEVRSAADWSERLPRVPLPDGARVPPRTTRVVVRRVEGQQPIRERGELLGWAERLGQPIEADLTLEPDRLVLDGEGLRLDWPLERLTAVQPSSSTLQLKAHGEPLVSLEFVDESVRMWEDLLQRALRRHYRDRGGREILEFQPRILAR